MPNDDDSSTPPVSLIAWTFSWAIIKLDQPCVLPSIREDSIVLLVFWEIASANNCKVKNKKNFGGSFWMYSNYKKYQSLYTVHYYFRIRAKEVTPCSFFTLT